MIDSEKHNENPKFRRADRCDKTSSVTSGILLNEVVFCYWPMVFLAAFTRNLEMVKLLLRANDMFYSLLLVYQSESVLLLKLDHIRSESESFRTYRKPIAGRFSSIIIYACIKLSHCRRSVVLLLETNAFSIGFCVPQ